MRVCGRDGGREGGNPETVRLKDDEHTVVAVAVVVVAMWRVGFCGGEGRGLCHTFLCGGRVRRRGERIALSGMLAYLDVTAVSYLK